MTVYDNARNLRTRKMDWMRNSEWAWYTTFVDLYSDMHPTFIIITWSLAHGFFFISLGVADRCNQINAPPLPS